MSYKVVVCEDDPINILLLKKALALIPGVEVEVHKDLGSALLAIQRLSPALVIMDHHLPGATGSDGLKRLRNTSWGARIPVVIYTGADVEEQAMAAGASGFLRKPCTADDIVAHAKLHMGIR